MRTPVESYVVRVYRRHSGAKRQLVGVLEGPRLVGAQAFSSVEELWEILEGRGMGQGLSGEYSEHTDASGHVESESRKGEGDRSETKKHDD